MIINYPKDKDKLYTLHAGDTILFTGVIYTARDQAHLRIKEMLDEGKKLPVDFKDAIIYYAGPTPTPPNRPIGSIGPTTSARMDKFSSMMKTLGIVATIGKGPRGTEASKKYMEDGILYFITTGGIGALLSMSVKKAEEIAFKDLGPESIKRLDVVDFPMTLAIDNYKTDLFERIHKND